MKFNLKSLILTIPSVVIIETHNMDDICFIPIKCFISCYGQKYDEEGSEEGINMEYKYNHQLKRNTVTYLHKRNIKEILMKIENLD